MDGLRVGFGIGGSRFQEGSKNQGGGSRVESSIVSCIEDTEKRTPSATRDFQGRGRGRTRRSGSKGQGGGGIANLPRINNLMVGSSSIP